LDQSSRRDELTIEMKMTQTWLFILLAAGALRAADLPLAAPPLIPAQLEQPPQRPGLVIRSDEATAVLRSNIVHYTGNVVVIDPPAEEGGVPTELRCGNLTAIRGTNGRLESVVAEENVMLIQNEMSALGERAVYTAATERIVLTGAYKKLEDLTPELGAFLRTNPLPVLISTRTNSPGASAATTITYNRADGTVSWKGSVFTDLPAVTLRSASTNANKSPSPFNGRK
jgi:lipopolysaccharide export system protein LptA